MVKFTERVKEHVKKHKELYLGIGVGVGLAGITCLIMKDKDLRAVLPQGADGRDAVTTGSLSFANNSKFGDGANIVTAIHYGTAGHPGFITKCVETQDLFGTQGEAARSFGIPENVMSMHLNGKIPDAAGLHFERQVVNY